MKCRMYDSPRVTTDGRVQLGPQADAAAQDSDLTYLRFKEEIMTIYFKKYHHVRITHYSNGSA
jgi:hypothetical protein